jgi:predicted metal-dependent phosphoesterase TrpH
MSPIDLHTHSTKSDGTFSPEELVRYAQLKGLSAIALTDHDTADGIEEALLAADKLRKEAAMSPLSNSPVIPEVIPGVELSTEYRGRDIHIVGLFIDWKNPEFISKLREFADARIYRNQKMCRLLTEGGYPVEYDDLQSHFPDTVITRAHFAQYMLEKGFISSIDEAFRRLIGDDCPFFVPREKISPQDGVSFLLQYGAVPILAHPFQYKMSDSQLRELLVSLCEYGLSGIEVYYSGYKPADTAYLSRLAEEFGLLPSGGSDFHGSRKKGLDLGTGYGHLYVPETLLPPLRAKAAPSNR